LIAVWRSTRNGNFISYIARRWLSSVISDWQRSRTLDQVYSRPEIQRTLLRTRRDSLTASHNAMLCVITLLAALANARLWLSIQLVTIELNPGLVNKLPNRLRGRLVHRARLCESNTQHSNSYHHADKLCYVNLPAI